METALSNIGLGFSAGDVRTIGQQMQTGLTPFLNQMNEIMRRRGDELSRIGFGVMTLVIGTLGALRGLRSDVLTVQVLNLDFLELMAAGSFAFIVLIFLKLWDLDRRVQNTNVKLDLVNQGLGVIQVQLNAILSALNDLKSLLQTAVNLLGQILAKLNAGLTFNGTLAVSGTVAVTILVSGGGGGSGGGGFMDWLSWEDIAKLLALGTVISGFVAALGLALQTFTGMALAALAAVGLFLASLKPFLEMLAKLSWKDIAGIAAVLGMLDAFILGLGKALGTFNEKMIELLPVLGTFIKGLGEFATTLSKLSWKDVASLAASLAALGGFLYALGQAIGSMSAETVKALPALGDFLKKLQDLALALAKLSAADVAALAASLTALAGFVYALGQAIASMSADTLEALGPLGGFLDKLKELAVALAAFSAADVAAMTASLAALAGFVWALSQALAGLSASTLEALPALSEFLTTLQNLAVTLAALSAADVAAMTVALAALALFVYGLGEALNNFSQQSLMAMPLVSEFIRTLTELGMVLAAMSATDLISMGAGLGLLALFVYLLGAALNTFSAEVLAALPALAALLGALNSLAATLAGLSFEQLLMMAAGFAAVTLFVFGLGAALNFAVPGLTALTGAFNALKGSMDAAAAAASAVSGAISRIPTPSLGGLAGLLPIPSFQTGGIMPHTGFAYLHEGEQIVPKDEVGQGGPALATPAPSGGGVDQSVSVGAISISINAEKVDTASAESVSEDIVRRIKEKIDALRIEQDFRLGTRAQAAV